MHEPAPTDERVQFAGGQAYFMDLLKEIGFRDEFKVMVLERNF